MLSLDPSAIHKIQLRATFTSGKQIIPCLNFPPLGAEWMSRLTQATGNVKSSLDLRITNHQLSLKHCANYQTLFYGTEGTGWAGIQACAEAPC